MGIDSKDADWRSFFEENRMESVPTYPHLEPLIKADEAAKYLGFSKSTVSRMAHDGRLPSVAFPVGNTDKRTRRFRMSELQAYVSTLEQKVIFTK
jgi:excisionase family DNA binding protein